WLLSDNPKAVIERRRRRATHKADQEAALEALREGWRVLNKKYSEDEVLQEIAAALHSQWTNFQIQVSVDDAEPDDLAVIEARRRLESYMRSEGERPDYTYPNIYVGPHAPDRPVME